MEKRLVTPPIQGALPVSSTIIAGFDGSDASHEAVRFAVRLGRALPAQVVAVTGYPVPPHVFGKGASDGAEAALVSDAHTEADLTLADLHEDGVSSRLVRPGEPARALIEAADELEGDLIVVGRHHASRLALGSTGDRLIHGAPCPVSIVPASPSQATLQTLAVAYDAGDAARTALEYAARVARSLSARLVLISVVEPFADSRIEKTDDDHQRYRSAVVERADQAADQLRPGLDVEVRTLPGPAGEMLAAACKDDVDLLVAGSRGYGPLRAVLAGSVSRYLADHAPCPLIVVPRQLELMPADTPVSAAAHV
jgi:nucleotide-binding universal stress UspA family protein